MIKYDKVLFVGNIGLQRSEKSMETRNIFFNVVYDNMLKAIGESEDILMVPGLETPSNRV